MISVVPLLVKCFPALRLLSPSERSHTPESTPSGADEGSDTDRWGQDARQFRCARCSVADAPGDRGRDVLAFSGSVTRKTNSVANKQLNKKLENS